MVKMKVNLYFLFQESSVERNILGRTYQYFGLKESKVHLNIKEFRYNTILRLFLKDLFDLILLIRVFDKDASRGDFLYFNYQ